MDGNKKYGERRETILSNYRTKPKTVSRKEWEAFKDHTRRIVKKSQKETKARKAAQAKKKGIPARAKATGATAVRKAKDKTPKNTATAKQRTRKVDAARKGWDKKLKKK